MVDSMAGVPASLERIPLIAGNWKMNLDHLQAIAFVQKLAWSLKDANHDYDAVEVAVFPPFTDLRPVQILVDSEKLPIIYGAQDISQFDSGAYTGEISGQFLKQLECGYVIVGHSERRTRHGETDADIAAKSAAAIRNGIIPLICVGETAADLEKHGPSEIPAAQLSQALSGVSAGAEFVVAYEPVWAIGSGQAATPHQAQQVCRALRDVVTDTLGVETAARTRLLYGGSVTSGNIASFLREPDIDGALVGGASLRVDEFAAIARFRSHVGV
ncbi:triose-phosphate isomerase [Rathayibacter toxicus]|uniref:triose-phosphate isomerase n=1 Tax=Rathayibacter toxicus TaxID=145458 RepID=UPI001E4370E8|nr:triose-phosphate isomerase [Rathayibacter toxicus]